MTCAVVCNNRPVGIETAAQIQLISKLMASVSPSLMRPGPPLTVGIL